MAWIALRSKEDDFQQFLGVNTAEDAATAATLKCSDAAGAISQKEFEQLKESYLAAMRVKLGLPNSAGAL